MTKHLLLLGLVLGLTSACVEDHPDFMWDVGTYPHAVLPDGKENAAWTRLVAEAREKWSVPLFEQLGCADPFRGNGDVHDVELIPDNAWLKDNAPVIGRTYADRIIIKGSPQEVVENYSYMTVLPHEFGHALGLEHSYRAESVMNRDNYATEPDAEDITDAAISIGCIGGSISSIDLNRTR